MTIAEIEASTKVTLTPAEVAEVLGCKPYSINVQAQRDPDALGFPVMVMETRVRIPREGFLFYMKYGRPIVPGNQDFKMAKEAQA